MSGVVTVGYFLFSLFFSLLTFLLWARIGLRYFRVSTLQPIRYAINSLTSPVIDSISRLLPTVKNPLSRYDWVCFSILIAVEIIKFIAIGLLFYSAMMPLLLLLLYVVADLIVQPCNLLFYAILIRVIMSWVNPQWRHPLADVLRAVTEPLLRLGRRVIPEISGFDFSPFIIMIILKIITLFISTAMPLQLI